MVSIRVLTVFLTFMSCTLNQPCILQSTMHFMSNARSIQLDIRFIQKEKQFLLFIVRKYNLKKMIKKYRYI